LVNPSPSPSKFLVFMEIGENPHKSLSQWDLEAKSSIQRT